MWAILEMMRQLHIPQVWEELTAGRKNHRSLAKHLTALLCNRLDDPGSKLSLLAWLERVLIPGIDPDDITYQGLLRTMDVLLEYKGAIEKTLAERLLTMFDTELDLVLMDVTSISVSTTSSDHPLFCPRVQQGRSSGAEAVRADDGDHEGWGAGVPRRPSRQHGGSDAGSGDDGAGTKDLSGHRPVHGGWGQGDAVGEEPGGPGEAGVRSSDGDAAEAGGEHAGDH